MAVMHLIEDADSLLEERCGKKNLIVVGVEHPNCCQGQYHGKPCTYHVYVGPDGKRSNRCIRHNAFAMIRADQVSRSNYTFMLHRDRIQQKAENPRILSLRDEIALTRTMAEVMWNDCKTDEELKIAFPRVQSLMADLSKMVNTCNALETKTRFTLDRSQIYNLVDALLQVVIEVVDDQEKLQIIGEKIERILMESQEVVVPTPAPAPRTTVLEAQVHGADNGHWEHGQMGDRDTGYNGETGGR